MFDRTKYKTILKFTVPNNYPEMLDWVNSNTNGSVKVELSIIPVGEVGMPWYSPAGWQPPATVYMGFENSDDAMFFKIKYAGDYGNV